MLNCWAVVLQDVAAMLQDLAAVEPECMSGKQADMAAAMSAHQGGQGNLEVRPPAPQAL